MLYLACTTISSVDLAQYRVSLAKDWVSVKCGTNDVRGAHMTALLRNGIPKFAPYLIKESEHHCGLFHSKK